MFGAIGRFFHDLFSGATFRRICAWNPGEHDHLIRHHEAQKRLEGKYAFAEQGLDTEPLADGMRDLFATSLKLHEAVKHALAQQATEGNLSSLAVGRLMETELEFHRQRVANEQGLAGLPAEFDVRKIMLDVIPDLDGEAHEIFAKSNVDVENALAKLDDKAEGMEARAEAVEAERDSLLQNIAEWKNVVAIIARKHGTEIASLDDAYRFAEELPSK